MISTHIIENHLTPNIEKIIKTNTSQNDLPDKTNNSLENDYDSDDDWMQVSDVPESKTPSHIYALRLKNDMYYIGHTTRSAEERLSEHQQGNGSEWTKKYCPISLIYWDEVLDDEDAYTKCYYFTIHETVWMVAGQRWPMD